MRDFDVLPPSGAGQIRRERRDNQTKVAGFTRSLGVIVDSLDEQEDVLGVKVSVAVMDADSVEVRARRTRTGLESSGIVVHGNRIGLAQRFRQMKDAGLKDLAQRDVEEDGKNLCSKNAGSNVNVRNTAVRRRQPSIAA
jgi:hypothetical protein